jgi:hypothetical protein
LGPNTPSTNTSSSRLGATFPTKGQ